MVRIVIQMMMMMLLLLRLVLSILAVQEAATATGIMTTDYQTVLSAQHMEPKMAENTDCPFTFGGTFVPAPGRRCFQYTSSGTFALDFGQGVFNPTLFLPAVVCAPPSATELYGFGNLSNGVFSLLYVTIFSQQTVSVNGFAFPTFPTVPICAYPTIITTGTFFNTATTTETVTQTGFIELTTFATSTQSFSATITFTTTRTFFTTTTSSTTVTFTVDEFSSTTLFTSSTITFSTLTVVDMIERTTTVTYVASTKTSVQQSPTTLTTSITNTLTTTTVSCLKRKRQIEHRGLQPYPQPYILRADQAQCTIPYAGSVYNSNPGSSMSTICNVAGGTQVLTNYTPLYTWLWSMIKTWTPCNYATSLLWVGSSTGTCFALENGSTTSRPCSEIYPVICLSTNPVPVLTFSTVNPQATTTTTSLTSVTTIATRTTTFTIDILRTTVSSVIITVPSFVDVSTTLTRVNLETATSTKTRTLTGFELTTETRTQSDTIYTQLVTSTQVVLTRTITSVQTMTLTSSLTVSTRTLTETLDSCIKVITVTDTIEFTFSTVITNIIPEYKTITYKETTCMPEDPSPAFECCNATSL